MRLGCTEAEDSSAADCLAAGPVLVSVSISGRNALYGFFLHPLFLASQAQTIAKSLFKNCYGAKDQIPLSLAGIPCLGPCG